MMTKAKQYKLRQLDNDLLIMEKQADEKGIDIDNLPAWQALVSLVTDYHMGDRRHSKSLLVEYGKLQKAVMKAIGV